MSKVWWQCFSPNPASFPGSLAAWLRLHCSVLSFPLWPVGSLGSFLSSFGSPPTTLAVSSSAPWLGPLLGPHLWIMQSRLHPWVTHGFTYHLFAAHFQVHLPSLDPAPELRQNSSHLPDGPRCPVGTSHFRCDHLNPEPSSPHQLPSAEDGASSLPPD